MASRAPSPTRGALREGRAVQAVAPKRHGRSPSADRPPGGRYVIEASNDGGNTWDILVGLDGTEAVFGASTTGIRAIEAVTDRLRVRSVGNGPVASPPSITVTAATDNPNTTCRIKNRRVVLVG